MRPMPVPEKYVSVKISLYTYEIEVIYYTESTSLANRDNIDLYFGDNTVSNVLLSERILLQNHTFFNSYKTTHTLSRTRYICYRVL